MKTWKSALERALGKELPGERSHLKMIPPGRPLHIGTVDMSTVKQSGVLVLVFPSANELVTCLIRRPGHMKDHAGQIGFPGGKMEPYDDGTRETALREAREEIGLDRNLITVLGALTPLFVPVSKFLISPWVAWCDKEPAFTLNQQEVDKLLLFPLLAFVAEPCIEMTVMETFTGELRVPVIPFGGETIWGASAMILTELTDLIVPMMTGY